MFGISSINSMVLIYWNQNHHIIHHWESGSTLLAPPAFMVCCRKTLVHQILTTRICAQFPCFMSCSPDKTDVTYTEVFAHMKTRFLVWDRLFRLIPSIPMVLYHQWKLIAVLIQGAADTTFRTANPKTTRRNKWRVLCWQFASKQMLLNTIFLHQCGWPLHMEPK